MVKVKVYTLETELCSVEVEPGCTGRQLKEAIEEATHYTELICTQCLALGLHAIRDDEVVNFGDEAPVVMMTRRPPPRKILRPSADTQEQKALALAMRHFAFSPVVLELPMHGIIYGIGQEEVEGLYSAQVDESEDRERAEVEHRFLNSEMFEICLPWKYVAGVAPDQISAVLALQSHLMIIGDGVSFAAAVLLLRDGRLLALTALIDEATRLSNFQTMITSATLYADTCEALFDALPSFAQAMCSQASQDWLKPNETIEEPGHLTSPWVVKVHVMDLDGWTCGWWPRGEDRFSPARDGLPNMPFRQFIPQVPEKFRKAFFNLLGPRSAVSRATNEVEQICRPSKGKGRGGRKGYKSDSSKECLVPFSEAISRFKAGLATSLDADSESTKVTFAKSLEQLEPYLKELEAMKPPETLDYDFMKLVNTCLKSWETDLVFGAGKTSGEV